MACRTPCVLNSVQFALQNGTPQRPPDGRLKVYARGGAFHFVDAAGVVHDLGPGTVTSVGASSPDGSVVVTGGPITTSGTFQFSLHADLLAFIQNAGWAGTTLSLVGSLGVGDSLDVSNDAAVGGNLILNGGIVTFGVGGPTIVTSGGVPVAASPDGSLHLRSGAPNGDLYVRRNSAWVTLQEHSADLDSFVTNATWLGADLTLAGVLTVQELATIQNITAGTDLHVNGDFNVNGVASFGTSLVFQVGPTITTGTAIPSAAEPDGSIYLRRGSPNGSLYVRENGAWVLK